MTTFAPRFSRLLALVLGLAVAGCASGAAAPLPAEHPASARAEEAPAPEAAVPASPAAEHEGHTHAAPGEGATYTCPMHPEVKSSAPGSCPKCGMTLRPKAS